MTEAAREITAKGDGGMRRVFTPAVDVIKRKDDLQLMADMPGVDEKTLDILVEKNVLTITGRVIHETPEQARMTASEYGVGDYKRVFTISDDIDRDRIQASVKNGVLRVTLPKAEAVKTKRIEVKAVG